MQPLSLRFFRVGLNVSALHEGAKALLTDAEKAENLQTRLGWTESADVEFLKEGFAPQKNGKEFLSLFKNFEKQQRLRAKRVQGGFTDLLNPGKGLRGWLRKRSRKKELAFPIGFDVFEWLANSKRLALLSVMHDSLLNNVMVGNAEEVDFDEIHAFAHPWAEMVQARDEHQAERMVQMLNAPLHKVDPLFLVNSVMNYVVYQPHRGFAYFYAA